MATIRVQALVSGMGQYGLPNYLSEADVEDSDEIQAQIGLQRLAVIPPEKQRRAKKTAPEPAEPDEIVS